MTVKELIEKLENIPEDTPIFLDNGEHVLNVDEINFDYYYGYLRKIVIS